MDMWSKDASERMKIKIDQRVLADVLTGVSASNKGQTAGAISGDIDLGVAGTPEALTASNVIGKIIDMGTVLDEANCPEQNRFIVIPGDGNTPLRNGRLGMIDRFTVYVSHNLVKSGSEFSVLGGHSMGFTFASQMTNMETIRSETTFGNIIRGLQVYGYQVVKPEALATMIVTL